MTLTFFTCFTGYVVQCIPYFSRDDRSSPFKLYQDVVLKLLMAAEILGKGFRLFIDNFYTSVELMEDLWARGTYACGTIRRNRKGLPKALMVKKHKGLANRGDTIFSKCCNMLLTCWRDRRIVHVLSTIHGALMGVCRRTVKGSAGHFERREIARPESVAEYSRFMGGVDLADQMFQYYSYGRKSRKWTKKLFFYALELFQLNSYIMYNSVTDKKVVLFHFTLTLVQQMLAHAQQEVPRIMPAPDHDRLTARCMPEDLHRKSYCRVCYHRHKNNVAEQRRQTKYGCSKCEVHLCLPHCFRIYHTVRQYATYIEE